MALYFDKEKTFADLNLERRLFKAVAKLVGFGIFVNSAGLSLLS
jgi:hypothetical protein